MSKLFDRFTNQYSLSKTLRFELKPVGKTRENMNKPENFNYQEGKNDEFATFLADQKIENAYQILKPVLDKIHEEFITASLEGNDAKRLDFSNYFEAYKNYQLKPQEDKRKDKVLENEEKNLRKLVGGLFKVESKKWKNNNLSPKISKKGKVESIFGEDSYRILTEKNILIYIEQNIQKYGSLALKTIDGKLLSKQDIEHALKSFKGFWTYFSGYNQNRENYYTTEGKATEVAYRIVDDNLPKFVDNIIVFEKFKSEYLDAYDFLMDMGLDLDKVKNPHWDGVDPKLEFVSAVSISEDMFTISAFPSCLSQKEIENYNHKIANANFIANLYNQQNGESKKLPKFKVLYKQIGCGKKKEFIKTIKDKGELKKILEKAANLGGKYLRGRAGNEVGYKTIEDFCDFLLGLQDFENIYWSDKAINIISSKYFANWFVLREELLKEGVFNKDKSGEVKVPSAVMLSEFFKVLDKSDVLFKDKFKDNDAEKQKILKYSTKSVSRKLLEMIVIDIQQLADNFMCDIDKILNICEKDYQKDENKRQIKLWLDNALFIVQILKYFRVKSRYSVDSNFLYELDAVNVAEIVENYDAIRNFLTKKPQGDLNKLKLNFENSVLAAGWDENKVSDNYCTILKDKENHKFLAIITKDNKDFFKKIIIRGRGKNRKEIKNDLYNISGKNEILYKMEYKQIATPTGVGGFVRKCFNSAQQYGWVCPQNCLNKQGKIIIENDEAKGNLEAIINCYKDFFDKYEKDGFKYKDYNFIFKDSAKYKTLNDFFADVKKQGYKLSFPEYLKINRSFLDKSVEEGKIYLFEINSKDNDYYYDSNNRRKKKVKQKGGKDLQTIYWDALFESNVNKPMLNGGAEIFFRPALFGTAKDELKTKDKNNKEIYKNFRFTKEKLIFHCPITLNFGANGAKLNDKINAEIANGTKSICILGVDRGEKHLAYYSLIDSDGRILKQGTLNIEFKKPIRTMKWFEDKTKAESSEYRWYEKEVDCYNYKDLLDARASNRDKARKNWATIGNIKDLKDGYISQVVRKIVDLAVENNALIVLENLTSGFKNSRKKIEQSAYQKLELALAKKLNFLVDKKAKPGEVMSVEKAMQLTPPVTNFDDIENVSQWGIMLYTRANYTSQTDPVTGWRRSIYFKSTKKDDLKVEIFKKFDEIGFDGKDYYFDYTVRYADGKNPIIGKKWRLWSGKNGVGLDRFRGERNNVGVWEIKQQNVKELLDQIFNKFDKGRSLYKQMFDEGIDFDINKLKFAIDLIQQIRNIGISEKDDDFLQSPVRNQRGEHFDSRKAGAIVPNGDANGAYNIARKGLIMVERIAKFHKLSEVERKKKKYPDLYIRDEDWDRWLDHQIENA